MKTYLVGGAVRDMLMGRSAKDLDYVVVGSSPEEMLDSGFTQVGADFPVFLQPHTGYEFALARREKKTGTGYLGFESDFSPEVTLEEDLKRRDLTINSIAYDVDGYADYIDPFKGKEDINNRILRHTSDAFQEDPVRVLRIARFRARFGPDWSVAEESKTVIRAMSRKGVLNELNAERVWKELSRALLEPFPRLFFDTLLECDVLQVLFPDIYRLKTALEAYQWHPEGDAYEHTMLVLEQACSYKGGKEFNLTLRMCALTHDLGKGVTPRDKLPKHHGHEIKGVSVVKNFCNSVGVPAKIRDRCMKVTRYHMNMHKLKELNSKTVVRMFNGLGAKNDHDIVNYLYFLGKCDARGRKGCSTIDVTDKNLLINYWLAFQSVKFAQVFPEGATNTNKIKDGMLRAQIKAINTAKNKGNTLDEDSYNW